MAPNLITLLGFVFVLLPHALMVALYGNDLEGPIDGWFCVFMGLCGFCYNTLDNCDGKQARRTGSGSPMGMLFDHGIDVLTCVLMNLQFLRMLQMGSGLLAFVQIMIPIMMSYYLFLEEFYLGKLQMGKFSNPDDSGIALTLLCFWTAFAGSQEFWG